MDPMQIYSGLYTVYPKKKRNGGLEIKGPDH